MRSVLLRLREVQDSLSTTESYIAEYIRSNAHESINLTVREMADKTFTSPSSVVRLCRTVGFSGYKEFKQALLIELASINQETQNKNLKVEKEDTISTIIDKVTYQNIKSLEETLLLLDNSIVEKSIDLILNSKRILLFGIGSSQFVARDFYLKLLRLNKNSIINEDVHSQLLQAKNSAADDVAIMYSYSGETKEVLEYLEYCQKNKTPVIAITRYSQSNLSLNATYRLYTSASEPLFRNGAMSSRLSQLNINDILYTGMINKEYDRSMNLLTITHIKK